MVIRELTLGHFDLGPINEGQAVPLCSLDRRVVEQMLNAIGERDHEGRPTLGGLPVQYSSESVVIRWLVGSFRNRKAEEFAVRLHKRTGCLIADVGSGRLIDPEELAGGERAAG